MSNAAYCPAQNEPPWTDEGSFRLSLPLRLRDHSRLLKNTFINAAASGIAGPAAIAHRWFAVIADVDDEMTKVCHHGSYQCCVSL